MGEGRSAAVQTSPESRVHRRKASTGAAILKAAERHFLARGYYATKIEDIATDAGVATGSIYVHFGSKEGLYLALLERALEVEERYLANAFDPAVSPADQLTAAGEAYLRFYLEHPGYFRILAFPTFVSSWKDKPSAGAIRLARLAEAQIDRLAAAIEQAVALGLVRKVDPVRAAKFLWGAWVGVITLNTRPDRLRIRDEELELVLEEGRAMIAWGLAAALPMSKPRQRARAGRTQWPTR